MTTRANPQVAKGYLNTSAMGVAKRYLQLLAHNGLSAKEAASKTLEVFPFLLEELKMVGEPNPIERMKNWCASTNRARMVAGINLTPRVAAERAIAIGIKDDPREISRDLLIIFHRIATSQVQYVVREEKTIGHIQICSPPSDIWTKCGFTACDPDETLVAYKRASQLERRALYTLPIRQAVAIDRLVKQELAPYRIENGGTECYALHSSTVQLVVEGAIARVKAEG